MTTGNAPSSEYDLKAPGYFTEVRPEMLKFIPLTCKRVLDVGCAGGGFGASLKRSRPVEVWGVEPAKAAATEAATKLDNVIHGFFQEELKLPEASFDCVVFNDVLEHMPDPLKFFHNALRLLRAGGLLVVCVPNRLSFLQYTDNILDLPPHHMSQWTEYSFRSLEKYLPLKLLHCRFEPLSTFHRFKFIIVFLFFF